MKIRNLKDKDRDWVQSLLNERWGAPEVVSRGIIHHADQLPGFIAVNSDESVGLITYNIYKGDCEIVTLDALESDKGIGTRLVKKVIDVAFGEKCGRVWLITTNDNIGALYFYQKIGFELVRVYRDAIKESRKLNPKIPQVGNGGILIRDEIELEKRMK